MDFSNKYVLGFTLALCLVASGAVASIADVLREIRTICHCGSKATMVVRQDGDGKVIREGAQIEIGGNERYVSLCRRHWNEAMAETAGGG